MASRLWQRLRRRLRVLFRRADVESELSDEIRLHLDMESEELMRQGMTRAEARREARLRLGGVEQTREAVRAARVLPWAESIWQDIRYGLRQFRRAPGLFLAVVASLAIGLGANTAMFNLVDALLFRPPDQVRDPERIVHVPIESGAEYSILADSMRSLDLFAYSDSSLVGLGRGEDAVEARMQRVTDGFFSALGAAPARGREFSTLNDGETTGVAVLNHRFWERHFRRDAGIVGRNIQIDGGNESVITVAPPGEIVEPRSRPAAGNVTIIGVAPPGFSGADPTAETPDIWTLMEPDNPASGGSIAAAGGRMRDGWTLAEVNAEFQASEVGRAMLESGTPGDVPEVRRAYDASHRFSSENSRENHLALGLTAGSFLTLLVACANVAGLLLVRGVQRRREITLRLQLGASRARIVRQWMVESVTLALLGGPLALVVTAWVSSLLESLFPLPVEIPVDFRAFAVMGLFALASGIIAGIVPTLGATRAAAPPSAQGRQVVGERSLLRSGLLVGQVAMALVLIISTGLYVRSLQNMWQGLGFEPDRVVVVWSNLSSTGRQAEEIRETFDVFAARLREVPQIESVSLANGLVLNAGRSGEQFMENIYPEPDAEPEDRPYGTVSFVRNRMFNFNMISPGYFSTLGTQVLRGRGFLASDDGSGVPVIVVDEQAANSLWPGEDPIGQCAFRRGVCFEVVGVVESRRTLGMVISRPEAFVPIAREFASVPNLVSETLYVRSRIPPAEAVPAISAAIHSVAADLPFVGIQPLSDFADAETRLRRLGATILGLFGALSTLLVAVGIYGVLAFSVRQRISEIGVRMALGATPNRVLRMLLRDGLRIVSIGAITGIAAAFALTRFIQSQLYRVSATDLTTFVLATLVVAIAAVVACLIPAVGAARMNPTVALRHE